MSIRIRRVDGANLNRVNIMQAALLPGDVPFSASTGWWWIAEDTGADGRDVGFAGLVQSARWFDAAYLCRSGVRPAARGGGLQKRLIRVREQKARALGYRFLITDTHDNPASANSLIACGFRLYEPRNPWGVNKTLYWRKTIAPAQS